MYAVPRDPDPIGSMVPRYPVLARWTALMARAGGTGEKESADYNDEE